MEVFAAYGAHADYHMGRVVEAVKQLPDADNTLFIYIVGDNGSSAEGGLAGSLNENLFFNRFPEKWDLWWVEAAKYNVLPLDWRGANPRMNAEIMGRPSLIAGRKTIEVTTR